MSSGSTPLTRRILALFVLLIAASATPAQADRTGIAGGIGVFTEAGPLGGKTATLQPGVPIAIYIKTDAIDPSFVGISAAQFGVEVDPRLQVLARSPNPDFLAVEAGPDDWAMASASCILTSSDPVTLITYQVILPASEPNPSNIRIRIRDFADGQPKLLTDCAPVRRTIRAANAGGVLLNGDSSEIVHISAGKTVLVEGRSTLVAWEAPGTGVTLNDDVVPQIGSTTVSPTVTTSYDLVSAGGPTVDQRSTTIQVIREPRVDFFTAELFDTGGSTKVRLAWSVFGADDIAIQGVPGILDPFGSALVAVMEPGIWLLTASNEWGNTDVVAALPVMDIPPVVLRFVAASPFGFGQGSTLEWAVFGADQVEISPDVGQVAGAGLVPIDPAGTTVYTLTATNAFGTTTQDVTAALAPALVLQFLLAPPEVFGGEELTLSWVTQSAETASISGVGPVPPVGSTTVIADAVDIVYTLTVTNPESSDSRSVSPTVNLPVTVLLSPNLTPFGNESTLLRAFLLGAQSATLEPGFGSIDPSGGDFPVMPAVDTTYTLTGINPAGETTASLTIRPRVPVVTLSANDTTPGPGEVVTLAATVEGADTATLEPGIGSIDPTGGTFEVQPTGPTTYILTASNPTGSAVAQVTITPPGPEATLTASKTNPFPDEVITLVATATAAETLTLEPGFGSIDPAGGSFELTVPTETTFILTATNGVGTTVKQVTVTPIAPLVTFGVSDLTPYPDETVTLTLGVTGAATVTLEPGFGTIDPTGGTFDVMVPVDTEYTVTATNSVGSTVSTRLIQPRPPQVLAFNANPPAILVGDSITLSWAVDHFDQIQIDPIGFVTTDPTGTIEVTPADDTTYVLTAINTAGTTTRTRDVRVENILIESFTATPQVFFPGQSVTLEWSVVGAVESVSIDGFGPQPFEGSLLVSPQATTTYTLRASGAGEEQTAVVTVSPNTPTTAYLSFDPDQVVSFGSSFPAFFPFSLYVILEDIVNGVGGFEFQVNSPPSVPLLQATFNGVNVGLGPGNFIVGLADCIFLPRFTVMEMLFIIIDTNFTSAQFSLSPATPSTFPNGLAYLDCLGNNQALQIGPPAFLDNLVAVTAIELSAEPEDSGIRVDWEISQTGGLDEVTLTREVQGEFLTLRRWTGSQASNFGSFVDQSVRPGVAYTYRMSAQADGQTLVSEPRTISALAEIGSRTQLLPNTPNPFNPSTTIHLRMAEPGSAVLTIYDIAGRSVWRRALTGLPAGESSIEWNGQDVSGQSVASGVYVVRMESASGLDSRRITLLK